MKRLLPVVAALLVVAWATPSFANSPTGRHVGDVFLLRGFADVFSRGLDEMGQRMKRSGIDAKVINHRSWPHAVRQIVANNRRFGRKPVILIGHSLGANAVIKIAEELRKRRIQVNYMVTFAATNPQPVPSNVRKVTNYYFATDGWGLPLKRGRGFRGNMKNIDFSNSKVIGHFNIEEQDRLQRQVINNTKRLLRRRGS